MPAINISGGNGLQAAIEALTAAINRSNAGGNGGGGGGGGSGGGGGGGGGGGAGGGAPGPLGNWQMRDPRVRIRSMQNERRDQKAQDDWFIRNQNQVWKTRQRLSTLATKQMQKDADALLKHAVDSEIYARRQQEINERKKVRLANLSTKQMQRDSDALLKHQVDSEVYARRQQEISERKKVRLANLATKQIQRDADALLKHEVDNEVYARRMQERAEKTKVRLAGLATKQMQKDADSLLKHEVDNEVYARRQQDIAERKKVREAERTAQQVKKNDDGLLKYEVNNEVYKRNQQEKSERKRVQLAALATKQIQRDEEKLLKWEVDNEVARRKWREEGSPLYSVATRNAADKENAFRSQGSVAARKLTDWEWNQQYSEAQHMNRQFDRTNRPQQFNYQPRTMLGSGMQMLGFSNPYVAFAEATGEAIKAVLNAPDMANAKVNTMINNARPYTDVRLGAAYLGRKGNYNSKDMLDLFYPGGNKDKSPLTPEWMKTLGIQPGEAIGALKAYGISPWLPGQGRDLVKSFGEARMSPYLGGMELNQYAQMAQVGGTLGITGKNPSDQIANMEKYWSRYQKVAASATMMGLDGAQSINAIEGLLKAQASAGSSSVSLSHTGDFWTGMAGTGLAAMRTGEGQMTMTQGANQFLAGTGYGGNGLDNVVMQRYIGNKLGGRLPTSRADVAKVIPAYIMKKLESDKTGFGQSQIQDLVNMGKSGNALGFQTMMQSLLVGHTDDLMEIAVESGVPNISGGVNQAAALAQLFNIPVSYAQAWLFHRAHPDSPLPDDLLAAQRAGMPLMPTRSALLENKGIADAAVPALMAGQAASGLPAGMIGGVMDTESSGGYNPATSSADAKGYMQIKQAAFDDMRKEYPSAGIGPDRNDLRSSTIAASLYLKDQIARMGSVKKGMMLYHWGLSPGHVAALRSGVGVPQEVLDYGDKTYGNYLKRSDPNSFESYQRTHAEQGQINMGTGQYDWQYAKQLEGAGGDAVITFTNNMNLAAQAASNFAMVMNQILGAHSGQPELGSHQVVVTNKDGTKRMVDIPPQLLP